MSNSHLCLEYDVSFEWPMTGEGPKNGPWRRENERNPKLTMFMAKVAG